MTLPERRLHCTEDSRLGSRKSDGLGVAARPAPSVARALLLDRGTNASFPYRDFGPYVRAHRLEGFGVAAHRGLTHFGIR